MFFGLIAFIDKRQANYYKINTFCTHYENLLFYSFVAFHIFFRQEILQAVNIQNNTYYTIHYTQLSNTLEVRIFAFHIIIMDER